MLNLGNLNAKITSKIKNQNVYVEEELLMEQLQVLATTEQAVKISHSKNFILLYCIHLSSNNYKILKKDN